MESENFFKDRNSVTSNATSSADVRGYQRVTWSCFSFFPWQNSV